MVISLLGMKFAAPRIPWKPLIFCIGIVILISVGFDALVLKVSPIFFWIGNIAIPLLCVYGFGSYWVKRKYIPEWSNFWPS